MEEHMSTGGKVVDHHGCHLFPERWFDLVVVLRADNEILYPRLEKRYHSSCPIFPKKRNSKNQKNNTNTQIIVKRGYSSAKITENITAEIMGVVLEEAVESYESEVVVELQSRCVEEMEENVGRLEDWVYAFMRDHEE
jgi:adenylate kinase